MGQHHNYAAFILRISLGIIFIAHSVYLKLVVFTLPGTAQWLESIGLPGPFAYVLFAAESLAGIALVLGYQVRVAALIGAVISMGAVWIHFSAGWLFTNTGGGWEYPALLAVASVVQALLGPGAFAVTSPSRDNPDTASAGAV